MPINPHAFEQYTIAFYNLENLFDYTRNQYILDKDFTPTGRKEWDEQRYRTKIKKLADVISKIGYLETGKLPDIIGVAEVESKQVLEDLKNDDKLSSIDYGIIHHDSPDERGIDVALLYNKKVFELLHEEPITVHLEDENGRRDTTRDILYLRGILAGNEVEFYVNHWPSRRDGSSQTDNKRIEVARQLINHYRDKRNDGDNYHTKHRESIKTIIMGDFNDDPENDSITQEILPHGFENLSAPLKTYHRGTVNHQFKWSLFDQIITSSNLQNDDQGQLYAHKVDIYDDIMLRQWKGRYRGQPARTFVGNRYKGGYSDHFPIYMVLRVN
ncbi:MAG: endonuclease/exonuclease/phosphatase [Nonlabens sp.]